MAWCLVERKSAGTTLRLLLPFTLEITNMAMIRMFEVISAKLMSKSLLMENTQRNGPLNILVLNLFFLLGSQYILKHVKGYMHHIFWPELSGNGIASCFYMYIF